MVSEPSFCRHLQQVIAQLGELHVFLGRAGLSSLHKFSRQPEAWLSRRLCCPAPVPAGSSCGCGRAREQGWDEPGIPLCLQKPPLLCWCLKRWLVPGQSILVPGTASLSPGRASLSLSLSPGTASLPSSLTCWGRVPGTCLALQLPIWAQGAVPGLRLWLIRNKSECLSLRSYAVSFTPAMAFSHSVLLQKNS